MSVATIGQNSGDTYSGCEDTDVRDNGGAVGVNFQSDPTCFVSKYALGDYRTNLIKFPGLTNLSGVTVTDAKLYWKVVNGSVDPVTITLRRMLRNWVVSQATGNDYSTGNAWTATMGVSNGNDRSNTVTCSVAIGVVNQYYSFTSAQFISDVQDMINNPSTNYGWDQERTDGADDSGYREFVSSDGTDGSRPYLEVTYTSGGGGGGTVRRMTLLGAG